MLDNSAFYFDERVEFCSIFEECKNLDYAIFSYHFQKKHANIMKYKVVTAILFCSLADAVSQIPTSSEMQHPQPAILPQQVAAHFSKPQPQPDSFIPSHNTQRQNEMILRHEQRYSGQQHHLLVEFDQDINSKEIAYEFPEQKSVAGTEFYRQAFTEIVEMLEGKKPLNLKRVIFLVENTYLDNQMVYEWFSAGITLNADIIKLLIEQNGYKFENTTAKKWGLHQFLVDSVQLKDKNGKVTFTHKPYDYDFEDPCGKQDWSKVFVTKLMSSGKGQCHSMPLLYLIMAEEIGVEAWLSYSPSHSYIKVGDGKGNLLNYETTNGYYTTDVWVQSSGYIKAEALRSGIYMDTMSKHEVIAACLADMAKGYAIKYGFDNFVLNCIEKSLEYSANNVYALQLKSDYLTYLFFYVIDQLGRPPVEHLPEFPKAYELFLKMHEVYGQIDRVGFEEMPQDAYERWLKSFEVEKGKQQKEIIKP